MPSIDYFARAPAAARADLYQLTRGFGPSVVGFSGVVDEANAYGALSVATPGMVRGMAVALERFGTLGLADTLAPAIQFAEEGLPVDWYQGMLIASQQAVLRRDEETARIFLADGLPPAPLFGSTVSPRIKQPDLGRTLRRVAEYGADGFYRGEVAERIVAHVQSLGGILTLDDFARYQPTVVDPLVIGYRDVELVLLPFQAGGTHVGEAFAILNGFDLAESRTQHGELAARHRGVQPARVGRSRGVRRRSGLRVNRLGPLDLSGVRRRASRGDRSAPRLAARAWSWHRARARGARWRGRARRRRLHDAPLRRRRRRQHGVRHPDAHADLRLGRSPCPVLECCSTTA